MTVLAAIGLHKSFGGVRAVGGVSFAVGRGELLAMIGPNGAGKSTCFNLVGGQLRPDAGRVELHGQDITSLPPRLLARRGVARTFQVTAVFASMTVRENVQVALQAHHRLSWRFWRAADAGFRDAALALLAQVDMDDQADRAAGVLAYGDLKRLELAVALAGDPRLLLMDEPTAGMAAAERRALMALVRRLASGRGLAVLFTEHDMEMVFGVADRILVLDRGELIAEGDAAAIRADARVRDVYLGAGSLDAGSLDAGP
jgi:branched-chain amino acid transport system ATP-binding protein